MDIQWNQLVPELLLKLSDTLHKQYRYIEHLHEELSCPKKYFWQSDCLSNLAILYGFCILDSRFLYWPLLWWWGGGEFFLLTISVQGGGGYLISIAYCPFFIVFVFSFGRQVFTLECTLCVTGVLYSCSLCGWHLITLSVMAVSPS